MNRDGINWTRTFAGSRRSIQSTFRLTAGLKNKTFESSQLSAEGSTLSLSLEGISVEMTADYHNDHNGDDDGGGSHHRRFHYRHNMTNIISGGSDHDEGP